MDHFNVTVQKNGTLVSTRRGLQVSKHKHNGISFVNASGPTPGSDGGRGVRAGGGTSTAGAVTPEAKILPHRWKFVTRPAGGGGGGGAGAAGGAGAGATSGSAKGRRTSPTGTAGKTEAAAAKRTRKQPRAKGSRKSGSSSADGSHSADGSNTPDGSNTSAACTGVARPLPAWRTCRIPHLDEAQQRVFHQYLQLVPRKIYPFEDLLQYNPARSSEFFWTVVQDPAAVRCVLLCGAMLRAVLAGGGGTADLAGEVAHVCGLVSERLAPYQSAGATAMAPAPAPSASTLECVTTLALMAGLTGRYDHWHVHMRGLCNMVARLADADADADAAGPAAWAAAFARLRPSLQTKMRKTDLKGALALATTPYLPFVRSCPNASDAVLPAAVRAHTLAAVAALLAPFGTGDDVAGGGGGADDAFDAFHPASQYDCDDYDCDLDLDLDYGGIYSYSSGYHHTHYGYAYGGTVRPPVVDAVAQLCVFARAVQLAADRAATADPRPLDPHGFAEELYWLQHQLVCQPAALREATAASTITPLDCGALDDYVRNHQAPLTPPNLPVPAAYDSADGTPVSFLEPALRIAALLYLKELVPDFPRNLGGYAVLLHLLRSHLRPSLWLDGGIGTGTGAPTPSGQLLAHGRARAVLLWVCLLGDAVSRIADTNERRRPADCYDRSVFRARLAELVRSSDGGVGGGGAAVAAAAAAASAAAAVDGHSRLLDGDWALCRLLDLRSIRPGRDDNRQAVLQMLAESQASPTADVDGSFAL